MANPLQLWLVSCSTGMLDGDAYVWLSLIRRQHSAQRVCHSSNVRARARIANLFSRDPNERQPNRSCLRCFVFMKNILTTSDKRDIYCSRARVIRYTSTSIDYDNVEWSAQRSRDKSQYCRSAVASDRLMPDFVCTFAPPMNFVKMKSALDAGISVHAKRILIKVLIGLNLDAEMNINSLLFHCNRFGSDSAAR